MASSSRGTSRRVRTGRHARRASPSTRFLRNTALVASLSYISLASADCIPLKGSSLCPAFDSASVSTGSAVTDQFDFMSFVDSQQSFDEQFSTYLSTSYVKNKYQTQFGCGGINLTNDTELYARYTTTVLCNTLVQKSIQDCQLSTQDALPVCADTCAEFAQSEVYLTSDDSLCSDPTSDVSKAIRADFVTCSLPDGALLDSCINGSDNESQNCGYGNSTIGFCSYCAAGGINSTDTCCYNSNAEDRCKDVKLPTITSTLVFSTSMPTSTSASTMTGAGGSSSSGKNGDKENDDDNGLSGGAIAGAVIGSLAAVALIALLLFLCLRLMRRRKGSQQGSILNQPSPSRRGPSMSQQANQEAPSGYEVLPGGRIARMSALEGHSGDSPTHHHGTTLAAGAAGLGAGYMAGKGHGTDTQSSSDEHYESAASGPGGVLRPPPASNRRQGSLSSGSALGVGSAPQSPTSALSSSPPGVASQQSEQLPFFKDYYSQDDIHPGDRVAVLWAYEPRAVDEFALERGHMLKVVGIWDDGWATGVMLNDRAEDWETRRAAQRDSGVSNTSGARDASPVGSGEIKAFPLVCVCLPEHWKKTIDGDVSTDSGTNYNASSS